MPRAIEARLERGENERGEKLTCDASAVLSRNASAESSALFAAPSPPPAPVAVAAAASSGRIASAAPMTRAQPTPDDARTLSTASRLVGRRAAAARFAAKDAPKSSSMTIAPPVASANRANRDDRTASRPPEMTSNETPSDASCERDGKVRRARGQMMVSRRRRDRASRRRGRREPCSQSCCHCCLQEDDQQRLSLMDITEPDRVVTPAARDERGGREGKGDGRRDGGRRGAGAHRRREFVDVRRRLSLLELEKF